MSTLQAAKGLRGFIEKLDYFRPSEKSFLVWRFSRKTSASSDYAVRNYNYHLWEETHVFLIKLANEINKEALLESRFSAVMAFYILFAIVWKFILQNYLGTPSIVFIITYLPFGAFLLFYFVIRRVIEVKNTIGKKYEEEINFHAERVITYARKFFLENNIYPKDFPITLRHNNYSNLIYEKKGENKFVAYIQL